MDNGTTAYNDHVSISLAQRVLHVNRARIVQGVRDGLIAVHGERKVEGQRGGTLAKLVSITEVRKALGATGDGDLCPVAIAAELTGRPHATILNAIRNGTLASVKRKEGKSEKHYVSIATVRQWSETTRWNDGAKKVQPSKVAAKAKRAQPPPPPPSAGVATSADDLQIRKAVESIVRVMCEHDLAEVRLNDKGEGSVFRVQKIELVVG